MKKYVDLFKQACREFVNDKAARLGAALAYYMIFSIAPLLLIAVAIAGIVLGREAVQGQVAQQLSDVFGETTAKALQEMIRNASRARTGVIATVLGAITLLLGAAGVVGQLKNALNTIWNVEPKMSSGFMGIIKNRFLSMAMVFGTGFLLLISLVVDAALAAAFGHLKNDSSAVLLQAFQLVVSFGIITVLFAAIFRYLPDIRVPWRDLWLGSAFTSFLFVLGKFLLAIYIARAAPGSSYGAAGSLVVLLVWVYWSAQILFFGAEFTQVYARARGTMRAQRPKATAPGERRVEALLPAATPSQKGGGAVKLLAGGAAGCLFGLFAGLLAGLVASFKTIKKILTW